uniref:Uncharacterized protein n=1 Tax=Mucochytrium quahogii TaxID=96639 RepID=A0A7S2WQL0_9STRA|mmetsp:Transcript_2974/g.4282  ORF Transcript_2974/g.4282 Transcript_2974/m.4282 type:complete len:215 (-) Transcript_2974:18-662(-)
MSSSGSQVLDRHADVLAHEVPKIGTAVKNFLTVRIANKYVLGTDDAVGEDGQPERLEVDANGLHKIAGAILRVVNKKELLSPAQWNEKYPQKEDQSGLERMEEIAEYRVTYTVCEKVRSNNLKVSDALGKTALKTLWPQLEQSIIEDATRFCPDNVVKAVLATFLPDLPDTNDNQNDTSQETLDDESSLIWSVDFLATLQRRSHKRKDNAKERT